MSSPGHWQLSFWKKLFAATGKSSQHTTSCLHPERWKIWQDNSPSLGVLYEHDWFGRQTKSRPAAKVMSSNAFELDQLVITGRETRDKESNLIWLCCGNFTRKESLGKLTVSSPQTHVFRRKRTSKWIAWNDFPPNRAMFRRSVEKRKRAGGGLRRVETEIMGSWKCTSFAFICSHSSS